MGFKRRESLTLVNPLLIFLAMICFSIIAIEAESRSPKSFKEYSKGCVPLDFDNNFYCVEFVRNPDGDTPIVNIHRVHPLLGKEIGIRLRGVDTPEIRSKSKCERDLAIKAKWFTFKKLSTARQINLINVKRGKYFRIEADVYYNRTNLGKELVKNKLARYENYKAPKKPFCKD